jgi:two-component system, LytTR family, response regulator
MQVVRTLTTVRTTAPVAEVAGPRAAGVSSLMIVASAANGRTELLELCAELRFVRVIAEVNAGVRAIAAAQTQRPDLILAAAPLADMTNGDLVRGLPVHCRHATVVVTSSAQDILPSIEAGVAECVVWPLTAEVLSAALIRARARSKTALLEGGRGDLPIAPAHSPGRDADPPLMLVGERERRLYPLDPRRVDCIQAADNYVRFWAGRTEYIARDTIKRLYPLLRPVGFIRIQRSLLLNIGAIAYVQPTGRGVFVFELVSGERLRSSQAYGDEILDVLRLRRRVDSRRQAAAGECS